MTTYPLSMFSKGRKTLIVEASSLSGRHEQSSDWPLLPKLMRIQSKSGVAEFFLAETKRDGKGDIQQWQLRPSSATLKQFPQLEGWRVVVFND